MLFSRNSILKQNQTYTVTHKMSAVCMILMILWLTVSAPFVFASEQSLEKQCSSSVPLSSNDDDSENPYGNNTEEKAPSSTSFSEEYLHDFDKSDLFSLLVASNHTIKDADTYHAFHGELLVPPPDVA